MDEFRPYRPARARGIAPARLAYAAATCFAAAALATLGASCTASENTPMVIGNDLVDGAAPSFVETPDATADAAADLVTYCPSDKCPEGYTTCPGSRFPCDVDLRNDPGNCGACGMACPSGSLRETSVCVSGRCEVSCNATQGTMNCDGLPDNGCEADSSNDNCGACGVKCTDPTKPCVARTVIGDPGCGCYGDKIACGSIFPLCVDPAIDDYNCGACENACDPAGDGGAPLPNTYFGCVKGQCGGVKCSPNYGNCDGVNENGCEGWLFDRNNCGSCGNACPGGQECRANMMGMPECMCPDSMTFCSSGCFGDVCMGECKDLAADPFNCGSCGHICVQGNATQSNGVCTYGSCSRRCMQGRADCNGNADDDCEIDTDSDPRNCGGCGKGCDAIAGQACVGGRCVVEPCKDQDAGTGAAR